MRPREFSPQCERLTSQVNTAPAYLEANINIVNIHHSTYDEVANGVMLSSQPGTSSQHPRPHSGKFLRCIGLDGFWIAW